MFDLGLSGRLWPIHFKPYNDELLSSWLVRLSHAHGMEPNRFCIRMLQRYGSWKHDLDRGIDDDMLLILAEKTATPHAHVLATTIRGYAGYDEKQLMALAPLPWLRCLGLRFPWPDRPWLQYCPYCLREDAVPYFRRCWRLAFMAVCFHHKRYLRDRCTNCAALIRLHRLSLEAKAMTECHHCSFDLRSASSSGLQLGVADDDLIQFQEVLLNVMETGWFKQPEYEPVNAISFFIGLQVFGQFAIATKRKFDQKGAFGLHLGYVRHSRNLLQPNVGRPRLSIKTNT